MGTKSDTDRTRANMIEAAGQLFAKHGYHGVSVRDICSRGGASLSALSYHFRDKDGLFRETLDSAIAAETPTAEQLALLESLPPRKALLYLVEDYARKLLAPAGPDWRILLLEREYLDPSPQFQKLLDTKVRPELQMLRELIARAAGVPDSDTATLSTMVMYGLVSSIFAYRQAIAILDPGLQEWCREGNAFSQLVVDLTIRTARFAHRRPSREKRRV